METPKKLKPTLMIDSIITSCLLLLYASITYAQTEQELDSLTQIGAMNAVRKAHQMTDLPIVPVSTLYANKKMIYKPGKKYKGMIYSSTREINTFVGQDVSIYTFMTALHNPRSVLYTERIDLPPYHGTYRRAYYGTVCSGLITYALGFKVTQRSADILVEDYFELIKDQSSHGLKLADLVCRNGHPALITGIERDINDKITKIEVCTSRRRGCNRTYYDENKFNEWLRNENLQIYRYKHLYKNVSYTSFNDFVAVDGEKKKFFKYNDAICANKGDKSCYITGDSVILNVFGTGDKVEIYKDSQLFKMIDIHQTNEDITLRNCPYGNYQARVVSGNKKSDYTRWKVIDVNVHIDKEKNCIFFSSSNSTPVYYEFCNIRGSRPNNKKSIYAAEFTETDIKKGFVSVKAPKRPTKGGHSYPFVKVHFECDYGMVINRPINWFE